MELSDYLYNEYKSINEKFYEDEKFELQVIKFEKALLKDMSLSQKRLFFN